MSIQWSIDGLAIQPLLLHTILGKEVTSVKLNTKHLVVVN